jgi:hypothetical protein
MADNEKAMEKYGHAWRVGDMSLCLSVLDARYTFSGVSPEPVGRRDIHKFFIKFREQAAAAGGPVITSDDFLRMTNVIRKEWPEQNALIESANWEIPGFATGVYHVLVHNGQVMWEQAKITEDSIEPSGDSSAEKNIKAMDAYSKALQMGDMKSCLPFLDPSYTFSGISEIPVPRVDIHSFFKEFRQQAEGAGGPSASSSEFLRMTTVMRKEWPEQNALLESCNWEIPGYAHGVKHVLVHNGKVMFAQAKIEESPKEASSSEKSKNEEAMDQYVEAWQIGDMRHCLSVLDPSYTFSGVPPAPVPKDEIHKFFIKFRVQAAGAGGPDVKSKDFLRATNVIRKEWVEQDALIESANWEIPGYAKGIYHVLVHNGKVMWEQAIVG